MTNLVTNQTCTKPMPEELNGESDSELQIEDRSVKELDLSNNEEQNRKTTLCTVALEFEKASPAPVYGSVSVNSSENVHFGNNTYFNGPVVIKQVVHTGEKSGIDNNSYMKTEGDGELHSNKPSSKDALEKKKTFKIKTWHKLASLVLSLVIIAIISTIVLSRRAVHQGPDYLTDQDYADIGSNISDPLQIAPFHLRMVSRSEWLAQPVEKPLDVLKQPVPWVIIAHTAAESCSTQSECVLRVRLIQSFHIESRGWYDIGYNFLVGGDGSAYIGRGWDYVGAHTKGYNAFSIGIAFIGTFSNDPPPEKQLEACKKLLDLGVRLGKLDKNYKLFGHRQLWSTQSPGNKTYDIIRKWPHFSTNITTV